MRNLEQASTCLLIISNMSSGEDIFKAGPDISNVIGVHLGVKLMVM